MRYYNGKNWVITDSLNNFVMINIDNSNNNTNATTITCDIVWNETIDIIPTPDNDQAPDCCTAETFNNEYCCR